MRVLFVCTANTCRSPMAERLARRSHPEHRWESAGVMATGIMHPVTARILAERRADADGFEGRCIDDIEVGAFDHVVLIGATAARLATRLPRGPQVHLWDVADPFEHVGTETTTIEAYRRCADDLEQRIEALVALASKGRGR